MDFAPFTGESSDDDMGFEVRNGSGTPNTFHSSLVDIGHSRSGSYSAATAHSGVSSRDTASTGHMSVKRKKKKSKSKKKLKSNSGRSRGHSPGLPSFSDNSDQLANQSETATSFSRFDDDDHSFDLRKDHEAPLRHIDEEIEHQVNSRSAIETFEKGRLAARRREEGFPTSMDSRSQDQDRMRMAEEARQRAMENRSRGTESSNRSRSEYIQAIMTGKSPQQPARMSLGNGSASVKSLGRRSLSKVEEKKTSHPTTPKSFVPTDWPEEKPKSEFDNMVIEVQSHHSDSLPPPPLPEDNSYATPMSTPPLSQPPMNQFPDYEKHYTTEEIPPDIENDSEVKAKHDFMNGDPNSVTMYEDDDSINEIAWYKNRNTRFSIVMIVVLVIAASLGIYFLVQVPSGSDSDASRVVESDLNDDQIGVLTQLSLPSVFEDKGSPQYKAAQFLLGGDTLVGVTDLSSERSDLVQRYTMAVLYYALSQESEDEVLDGWLDPGSHVCDWGIRILCDRRVPAQPLVEALDLSDASLAGSIPDEVEFLTRLSILQLGNNEIVGTIPRGIGSLERLATLDFKRNALSGTVPAEIGNLSTLKHLDLSYNFIEGTVPVNLNDLTQLTILDLSFNRMGGTISPDLVFLTELSTLNLRNNQLTGTIPRIFSDLVSLEYFHIDYNDLTGTIPEDYDFLGQFVAITASNNMLTGTIPHEVPVEETEAALAALVNGALRIRDIDISGNFISGTLPTLIVLLPALETMNMNSNLLEGPTTGFARSDTVKELYFGDNLFSGGLPVFYAANLEIIDYSGNNLNGTIPQTLIGLQRLTSLNVGGNARLEGTIPTDFGDSMRSLNLENSGFSGQFPLGITELTNLEIIILARNRISGTIPTEVNRLSLLNTLDLGFNTMQGSIPSELANCGDLKTLILQSNSLRGSIPSEFALLDNLEIALLDDNTLEGTFPSSICQAGNETDFRVDCLVKCTCCTDYCE